jgi:plasmid maintenance system antidote protein VapI
LSSSWEDPIAPPSKGKEPAPKRRAPRRRRDRNYYSRDIWLEESPIYRLRKSRNLTLKNLAKLCGYSYPYISKLCSGKRHLSENSAARIAPHLGVTGPSLLSEWTIWKTLEPNLQGRKLEQEVNRAMKLSNPVAQRLRASGLTATSCSVESGLSSVTVRSFLNNPDFDPSTRTIRKFAAYLGIPHQQFYCEWTEWVDMLRGREGADRLVAVCEYEATGEKEKPY